MWTVSLCEALYRVWTLELSSILLSFRVTAVD